MRQTALRLQRFPVPGSHRLAQVRGAVGNRRAPRDDGNLKNPRRVTRATGEAKNEVMTT